MNMQAIEDAMAMAGVPYPMADIYAMMRKEKPLADKVKDVLVKLKSGEAIKPEVIEKVKMVKIGRTKTRVATAHEISAMRTPYVFFKPLIMEMLQGTHLKCIDIANKLERSEPTVIHVLRKLQNEGLADCYKARGVNLWFLSGYNHSIFDEFKRGEAARAVAVAEGVKTYHSAPCERCGTTLRRTGLDKCCKCIKDGEIRTNARRKGNPR
jgi:transposase